MEFEMYHMEAIILGHIISITSILKKNVMDKVVQIANCHRMSRMRPLIKPSLKKC